MQIGPYILANPIALAPMAGVTDRPFRQLCRELGAGYVVTEMIAADPGLRDTRKSMWRSDFDGEATPVAVQIAGSDPQWLAEAAHYNVQLGAQIIDINMGCPVKKVCKKLAGSALLSNLTLVEQILDAVVAAVDVPVTLKIRTGPHSENRNGVEVAKLAEQCGISAPARNVSVVKPNMKRFVTSATILPYRYSPTAMSLPPGKPETFLPIQVLTA